MCSYYLRSHILDDQMLFKLQQRSFGLNVPNLTRVEQENKLLMEIVEAFLLEVLKTVFAMF